LTSNLQFILNRDSNRFNSTNQFGFQKLDYLIPSLVSVCVQNFGAALSMLASYT